MLFDSLNQLSLFRLPDPEPLAKQRRTLIHGRVVDYRLNTGRRRLTMTIDDRGLRVGAPRRLPIRDIESFIQQHGDWVLKKIDDLHRVTAPRHIALRDGVRLPVLDSEAEVRILPGANRVRWLGDTLILEARPEANADDLSALARRALQRRAHGHFSQRLQHYVAQIDRPPPRFGLSSARTRWGSCSAQSGIRINWRLIHLPPHIGDYVVAHEVAHLLEMNHSPRFWTVVESLFPEWKAAKLELKRRAPTLPLI